MCAFLDELIDGGEVDGGVLERGGSCTSSTFIAGGGERSVSLDL